MFSVLGVDVVQRRLAGSNGDPTFTELMDVQPDATSVLWSEYCEAFAGGVRWRPTTSSRRCRTASTPSSDPFHVSVVVLPRLSPSGTLADFPVFDDWTGQLASATLTVVDHTGVPFTIELVPADRMMPTDGLRCSR